MQPGVRGHQLYFKNIDFLNFFYFVMLVGNQFTVIND